MLSFVFSSHVAASFLFARTTSKAPAKAKLSGSGWLIGFLIVGLWLAGTAVAVRGQSALDGFDPNADDAVRVVVVQPDGKILIGGDFTTLSPNGGVAVPRNRIARLNPDGTLDTAFDPNANAFVSSIALQADGQVLVGGFFSSIGGETRNRIARLDATTGLADSFDPNADFLVSSIAVQADGKVLVGGSFTSVGGATRISIARLDATTGLADSFNPIGGGAVLSIVVQADGKILVGGTFGNIGGQPRNRIARLDATTGLADLFNPNANETVLAIAVQADGKILVGGEFAGGNSIGGQMRFYIARLDANTGLADSFNPIANFDVHSIAVQADGKILAAGFFGNIGGQARQFIARLDAESGLADSFNPNVSGFLSSIAVQADGKILAGGPFISLSPNGGATVTRNRIARLETDGSLDQTLNLSAIGDDHREVTAIALQPDGKILIGGLFTTVLGVPRNNIARLNSDGTLDTAFNPNANNEVISIAVQADGQILAGGSFNGANSIGGQTRNFMARLDATTGLADSFNPNANEIVFAIVVQPDGKILAGGRFSGANSIGGQTRNRIARLDAMTGAADSFDPNANADVFAIEVQSDGKILVGGDFTTLSPNGGSAVTRNCIGRLNPNGTLDTTFDPNASPGIRVVRAIAVQPDGKILVGGGFHSIGGETRNGIARLDPTTGLADSFDPNPNDGVTAIMVAANGKILVCGDFHSIGGQTRNFIARLDAGTGLADSFNPNASNTVFAIALQADGKILAGGRFVTIGGQTRNLFARLSNDTAALQNLTVTQTTITWIRGGSSPQLRRVTFEYSNDNVNYSPLGNGMATGSNWTRTGLSLSTGRNFYIRARGYYASGYENQSESITESVRNAFNAGPTAADATISGRTMTRDGAPVAGVVVALSGAQSTRTITDSSGNYRFANLRANEFYTVAPQLANYSFSPTNRSFSLVGNQTEAVFTAIPDAVMAGNAIDTSEYFVRQHYLDFLGREPEPGGFEYWSDQVNQCHGDPDCIRTKRIDVSAAFFMSREFQDTGSFVYRLYKGALGRQLRYDEFTADRSQVIGGPNLDASKTAFADAFVRRAEFAQKYLANMTAESFVDALLQTVRDAGTNLSSERASLIVHYYSGRTMTESRSLVVRELADNAAFSNAVYNESFVLMEYFAYLRRNPDREGYDFWLNVLNTGDPGNYRGMVCSFITSAEYQRRFSSVVTRSNAECTR
jgi:uncharacterized delta-60 repeat protein